MSKTHSFGTMSPVSWNLLFLNEAVPFRCVRVHRVELAPVAQNRGGRWSLPSWCSQYTIKLEGNVDRFWCNETSWELGETKGSVGFWISYSSSFFNLEVRCRIEESLGFLKKFLGTLTHSCCPAFCGWLPFSTLLENIFYSHLAWKVYC